MTMQISIREMTPADFDAIYQLWQGSAGVGLSESDNPQAITRFLNRNPGLSFLALDSDSLVGAVLCGHDGRRGYIHHLAVSQGHRRQGIGRQLVDHCLAALRNQGIGKCHIFVFRENQGAIAFWEGMNWSKREELNIMSMFVSKE
jgi:putative acetyltransferase